jgi:hypothetical protein
VQGHEGVVFISGKYLSLIDRKGVVGLRVSLGFGAGVHFNVGYNVRTMYGGRDKRALYHKLVTYYTNRKAALACEQSGTIGM